MVPGRPATSGSSHCRTAVPAPGDLEAALAALSPEDCYSLDVTTATGSKTQKIVDAVNSRFDLTGNPWPYPAADVVNYPRDAELISSSTEKLGRGNWDYHRILDGKTRRLFAGRPVRGSRYQVYLYELGLTYARNGKQSLLSDPDTLPAGYTTVDPPPAAVPLPTILPIRTTRTTMVCRARPIQPITRIHQGFRTQARPGRAVAVHL